MLGQEKNDAGLYLVCSNKDGFEKHAGGTLPFCYGFNISKKGEGGAKHHSQISGMISWVNWDTFSEMRVVAGKHVGRQ